MTLFLVGVVVGAGIALGYFSYLLCSKRSPTVMVDPWWLENADRWEFVRGFELRERQQTRNKCGGWSENKHGDSAIGTSA